MRCYQCGCRLSEHDFCTNCGADVALYKRIMYVSNRFYNEGLEKAQVRDLSGAIISLRQSLKFNKNNIEARNLLGLVYFEMGEVVAALSEWVISKNLRPRKNIADDYIDMVQANQARLDSINQTIKKYNQALIYCNQDSLDLAVIQLKKVLSLNPKFIRAHQLLALLYLNSEEWEKARKELEKCRQIDNNNTTTLRYLKEAEHMLVPEEGAKGGGGKKKNTVEEVIKYQSGNETIIQPARVKESRGASTLLNLGIGLVIGAAIIGFLVLPAGIQAVKANANDELRTVSEQSDAKTAKLDELDQKIKDMTEQNQKLQESLDAYVGTDGVLKETNTLLSAASAYVKDPKDVKAVAVYLDRIDQEAIKGSASVEFKSLYDGLVRQIGPGLAAQYYKEGNDAYRKEDYKTAIEKLEKAYQYDETNGDALFYLGNSYRETGDEDKAEEIYRKVLADFPGTEKANKSKTYLTQMGRDAEAE